MTRNEWGFRCTVVCGLLLCVGLYAEEAAHYLRYGWRSADNSPWTRDLSQCRAVPGSGTDIECPVRGYGMARYRYRGHRLPPNNEMVFIDRNQ
jgi:hypothetical protein